MSKPSFLFIYPPRSSGVLRLYYAVHGESLRASDGDITNPSLYVMSCRMIPVILSAYYYSQKSTQQSFSNSHFSAPKSASYCGASVCDGLACRSQTTSFVCQLSVVESHSHSCALHSVRDHRQWVINSCGGYAWACRGRAVCACKRAACLLNGVRRGLGHTFAGGSVGSEASVSERLFVSVRPLRERECLNGREPLCCSC
jgi:hypothetical protein